MHLRRTDFPVPDPKAPPPPPKPAPPPDGEFVYAFWNDHEEAEEPGPKRRVIDVAKESLALMSEALETLGDAFAIYGFSGYGRQDVEFHVAKEFNERLSSRSWAAMAAMQPPRSSRSGVPAWPQRRAPRIRVVGMEGSSRLKGAG